MKRTGPRPPDETALTLHADVHEGPGAGWTPAQRVHRSAIAALSRGRSLASAGNASRAPEIRIAVLGTYTLDYLGPLLTSEFERIGLYAITSVVNSHVWRQEILRADAELYRFEPNLVVCALHHEDLLPELFAARSGDERSSPGVPERVAEVGRLIDVIGARLPRASVYIVIPEIARPPAPGVLDIHDAHRGQEAVDTFVVGLRVLARDRPSVVAVDWSSHVARVGWQAYLDERLWYSARMRLNLPGLADLAGMIVRYYEASRGPAAKLVVVDLDNVLWGGVAGEVGSDGVELGFDGIGLAYRDFQHALLEVRSRGIPLAVASMNDPETAWDVFARRTEMVLKREDFVAARINWEPKPANILQMASTLGVSPAAVVFLDDDPVQREAVRRQSAAIVPELPADPARRPSFVRELRCLSCLSVTNDDRARERNYQLQGRRDELLTSVGPEAFLQALRQVVEIARLNQGVLRRAAQLCHRTNQFNLTSRRYSEAELHGLLSDRTADCWTISVSDVFGDSGLVGLAIVRRDGETAEIDTFLLSCRVLGRKIEDALLAHLVAEARRGGASTIVGRRFSTERNQQTRFFYPHHGFVATDDPTTFHLKPEAVAPPFPSEIRVEESVDATAH